jgi:hypothetical protein
MNFGEPVSAVGFLKSVAGTVFFKNFYRWRDEF